MIGYEHMNNQLRQERRMMSAEKKPVVAITIGDPAGIGPEITVATMMDKTCMTSANRS